MTENNAAQPVLTDEEIQDIADGFDIYGAKPEFARAIEQAVLSKLRAPVADGWRPIATAPKDGSVVDLWAVSTVLGRREFRLTDCWFSGGHWRRNEGKYGSPPVDYEVTHWVPLRSPNAALASAPVADDGTLPPPDAVIGGIPYWDAGHMRLQASVPVADDWTPTPANINALPEPVRNYVHQLVANADPAGMVAENVMLRDQTRQLDAMIGRLKEDLAYTAGMMTLEDAKKILGVPRIHAGLLLISGERVIGSPRAIREIKSMAAAAGLAVYQYWENEDGR